MRRSMVVALCAVLVLVATLGGVPPTGWAQQGPIKIGAAWPLTGLVAASGKDMLNGFELYLESINRTMAGRRVEFIMEDTGGVPANALTKTRKLVERDRVHLVMVGLLATEGYAVRDYVTRFRAITLFPIVAADDLTQRVGSPYIIRTGWASSQPSHPFAEYVYKTLRYRKVATIANDYAFGYEVVGGFHKSFEDLGGCVVQKIWNPLGTPDFGPFLAQLRRDVDAIFALEVGADAIRFMKQYEEFGLKARLPLIGGGVLTDESLLRSMGDEAIGTITALQWSAALATDHAKRFVDAYKAKFGTAPSYYAESLYSTGRWIDAAVRRIRGNVEDKTAFINALKMVELFDAARGPIKLDKYNNPIHNVYVRRVEKVAGTLQNTVIYTFFNVSQFWKYDPQKFLQQPLYTRDFPPLSGCR
ncbi:MAG: ABC transporter substrate-binding protein [Armatimonadota bacterium]|nr:ABC transporter substrate-binding protein [Armatimonadota bacterium]